MKATFESVAAWRAASARSIDNADLDVPAHQRYVKAMEAAKKQLRLAL